MNAQTTVFISAFGETKLGPKFASVFSAPSLTLNKNSKAYKAARRQRDLTEKAFSLMHEACYMAGVDIPLDAP